MKTIFVIFVGLIAHVNQPGSFDNTAVLIRAGGHVPLLLISADSKSVDPDDYWLLGFPRPDDVNDRYFIDLDNWSVTLSGTRGIFCNHPSEFLEHVPRLKTLLPKCGDLKKAVRDRQPNGEFAAFFDFRGGHVETIDYLKKQLDYTPTGGTTFTRCASCRTRYVADLDGDSAVLTFKRGAETHKVRVPANTIIEVQNFPMVYSGSHFHEFFKLFENCPDDAATVAKSTENCDQKRICNPTDPPFPFGDCTNSQWP